GRPPGAASPARRRWPCPGAGRPPAVLGNGRGGRPAAPAGPAGRPATSRSPPSRRPPVQPLGPVELEVRVLVGREAERLLAPQPQHPQTDQAAVQEGVHPVLQSL